MKQLNLITTTVLIFLLCAANGCKKAKEPPPDNPYGLPNATQTGANIFACRVNGKNWTVKSRNLSTSYRRSNNRDTFSFGGLGLPDSILSLISISIKEKIREGASFRLNDTTNAFAATFRINALCGPTSGYGGAQWNNSSDGHLAITRFTGIYSIPSCCTYGSYDTNAIVAGTFNFVVAIPGCDSIKVTDGRFDINYSQY